MMDVPAYLRTTLLRQRWLVAAERFERALIDLEPDYPPEKKRALEQRLALRQAALARAYIALDRLNLRFDPNQPRIPAGEPGAGQWTSGGGGASSSATSSDAEAGDPLFDGSDTAEGSPEAPPSDSPSGTIIGTAPDGTPIVAAGDRGEQVISPQKPNYHDYTSGPNMVCSAENRCSREQMADYLSRFAVPGQDPARRVRDKDVSTVYDPYVGVPVGKVDTRISADGLTITNVTRDGHIFYYGQVARSVIENPDGSMSVMTRGTGNNTSFALSILNQRTGPAIFDQLDARMRQYIGERHGSRKTMEYSDLRHSRHLSGLGLAFAHTTGATRAL